MCWLLFGSYIDEQFFILLSFFGVLFCSGFFNLGGFLFGNILVLFYLSCFLCMYV